MRRSTKIGGFLVGVGTGVAALLWMLRDRILRPESTPVGVEEAPTFRVSPPDADPPAATDDLSAIKGIGPVYKARLAAGGITSFSDLAAADSGRVAKITDVSPERAAEWVATAADHA